jgi:hypothetical protein
MTNATASAAGPPGQSPPGQSPSDQYPHGTGPYYREFIAQVMSDVYALLDYLSGRAWPSLDPLPGHPRPTRQDHRPGEPRDATDCSDTDCEKIDYDFSDRSRLFCRAMRVGEELGATGGTIGPTDAAFLIRVRDHLNVQAFPATGSSISFTLRVIEKLGGKKQKSGAVHTQYIIRNDNLDEAAFRLAKFVNCRVKMSFVVLLTTVALSTYVACGKLLLDTSDAVNRDFGANLAAISAETSRHQSPDLIPATADEFTNYPPSQIPDRRIDYFCRDYNSSITVSQACHQREELKIRKQNIHNLLRLWICPWSNISSDEQVAQWAATRIAVGGNYLLPVFYGLLGALGYVLRRLNQQLSDYLLTPRDRRANQIRVRLGMMTGACIGLFVNSSTGAATLTGIGGAAVTLTASSVAFLAGYGVEVVFKMLDGLMNLLFRVDEHRKGGSRA